MDKSRQAIDREVERTLQSIDEIERVEGNPYLYTQLRERMRQQSAPSARRSLAGWRIALASLLFLINIGSAYFYYQKSVRAKQAIAIETLASEYGLHPQEEWWILMDNVELGAAAGL